METKTITPDMAGCWFNGASSRTADELNVAVIDAALRYGWEPEDKDTLAALNPDGWFEDWALSEIASDGAREAEEYLNGIAPEGYAFGFDDGFYLWAVCEWDWFPDAMGEVECPHGDDCPNA